VGLRIALAALLWTAVASAAPTEVVLVKRPGVMAYEEVAEAFREGCRVGARVVNVGDGSVTKFTASQLVITVGQEAFDAVHAAPNRLIATLAFHLPEHVLGPPAAPAPELILQLLATARPGLKVIGAVHGPRSRQTWNEAREAAERLGIELRGDEVADGPAAVRSLRTLVDGAQALWLPGDLDVVTPQVFQFALRLQIERGIPVAAATRQQVHSGALLAVDFNPRDAGRSAADLANRILDGRAPGEESSPQPRPAKRPHGRNSKTADETEEDRLDLLSGARMTVNATVARRLGVDLAALERLGARVE
jgi:hypothetical protein